MKTINDCKNSLFQSLKNISLFSHFIFLVSIRNILIYICVVASPFLIIYLSQNNLIRTSAFKSKISSGKTDPIWFLHVSDFHLSSQKAKSFPWIYKYMNKAISTFLPAKVIITGDLTDNADIKPIRQEKSISASIYELSKKYHPYHKQLKEDWDMYRDLLEMLHLKKGINLIYAFGNHDIFHRYNSPSNFSDISTEPIHLYLDEKEISKTIRFIVINPYKFPSPPITFHRKVFPSTNFLSRLKLALEKNENEISILVCHNPRLRFISSKLFDLATQNSSNLKLLISGHWHPWNHSFLHFGKSLEVVSTPLFRQTMAGIITYDSGCCVYHVIDLLEDDSYSFLTKPMPIEQITDFDSFYPVDSNNEVEFRAISFSKSKPNLSIKGDFNGKLKCVKKSIQFSSLYNQSGHFYFVCSNTFPVHFHNKDYFEIEKIGDWNGIVKFPSKKVIQPFYEQKYVDYISTAYLFLYVFIFLCFLYPLLNDFKFFFEKNNSHYFTDQTENNSLLGIQNLQISNINSFVACNRTWILIVYQIVRRLLIALLVSSFFLPLSIFMNSDNEREIHKNWSLFIFYWFGYFLFYSKDGATSFEFRYHFIGSEHLVKYFITAILPSILLQFISKIVIVDVVYRKNYSNINSRMKIYQTLIIAILAISLFLFSVDKCYYHFMRFFDLLGLMPAVISLHFSIFPFFLNIFEAIEVILLIHRLGTTKKNVDSSDENLLKI